MITETKPLLDPAVVQDAQTSIARVVEALRRVILGKEDTIDEVVAALLGRGHVLLEGLPGLGKTELVKALSRLLTLDFRRIQFTPDLLPTDITGSHILQDHDGRKEFAFHAGPVFTNLLLADEINRASPKTQAALLEAMQERRVTIFGETRPLPLPFFVLATQNPIELEGTYPLPEAQLDRFMFHIVIEHPPEHEELEVVRATTVNIDPQFHRPITGADLVQFQRLVRRVPIADPVLKYALSLVRTSRPKAPNAPESVKKWVAFGASVRAAQYLVLGAKSRAICAGRYHVSFEDIRSVAHPVLRHRVLTNFRAESEGVNTDTIIDELLERVPVPASGM
jgi:MoxR-like ATPase